MEINGLMKAENEDVCCSYVAAVLLNRDKRKSTCIPILILVKKRWSTVEQQEASKLTIVQVPVVEYSYKYLEAVDENEREREEHEQVRGGHEMREQVQAAHEHVRYEEHEH